MDQLFLLAHCHRRRSQSIEPDAELKQTYEMLNRVQTAIQHKDWPNYNAAFWNTAGCSEEMANTLESLQTHHEETHHTFITQYSNGPLEGTNNKIKVIKRASFGHHNFFQFRTRVLYAFRIKTKKP